MYCLQALCGSSSVARRRVLFTVTLVIFLSLAILFARDRGWHPNSKPAVTLLESLDPSLPDRTQVRPAKTGGGQGQFARTPAFKSDQLVSLARTNLSAMSAAQLENLYFSVVQQLHAQCPSSLRIGDVLDGGWDVCFTEPFDIRKSQPCVAFSFGINNVWAYDDLLAEDYMCQVYMFDPSMVGVKDHHRKQTSWFFLTGLSANNSVTAKGWKMRTLCHLFKELGYAYRPVDILKVDIEFFEWESFEQAVTDGCLAQVKQLLFESHTAEVLHQKSSYKRLIGVWQSLFGLGFRTWKWHQNPQSLFFTSADTGARRACCFEHYMINTNFL